MCVKPCEGYDNQQSDTAMLTSLTATYNVCHQQSKLKTQSLTPLATRLCVKSEKAACNLTSTDRDLARYSLDKVINGSTPQTVKYNMLFSIPKCLFGNE